MLNTLDSQETQQLNLILDQICERICNKIMKMFLICISSNISSHIDVLPVLIITSCKVWQRAHAITPQENKVNSVPMWSEPGFEHDPCAWYTDSPPRELGSCLRRNLSTPLESRTRAVMWLSQDGVGATVGVGGDGASFLRGTCKVFSCNFLSFICRLRVFYPYIALVHIVCVWKKSPSPKVFVLNSLCCI